MDGEKKRFKVSKKVLIAVIGAIIGVTIVALIIAFAVIKSNEWKKHWMDDLKNCVVEVTLVEDGKKSSAVVVNLGDEQQRENVVLERCNITKDFTLKIAIRVNGKTLMTTDIKELKKLTSPYVKLVSYDIYDRQNGYFIDTKAPFITREDYRFTLWIQEQDASRYIKKDDLVYELVNKIKEIKITINVV